jgi:hypothetical protein
MGGYPYKILQTNFKHLSFSEDNLVLEIGSERGEGSSKWLHRWAYINNMAFISVDVLSTAKDRAQRYPGEGSYDIDFKVAGSGSEWCKNELPKLNKKIKVLYLDNFDWIWNPDNIPDWIKKQIEDYGKRGVVMNNVNCQEEHRLQLEYCLPYMDEQSIVIIDDTFMDGKNSKWEGKGGTCIPLLKNKGYVVKEHVSRCGVYAYKTNPNYVPGWIAEL